MSDDTSRDSEEKETVGGAMGELFTLAEAATYVQTTRHTLERYALRGKIAYQVSGGGQLLFRRGDLDTVAPQIAENRVKFRSDETARKLRRDHSGS